MFRLFQVEQRNKGIAQSEGGTAAGTRLPYEFDLAERAAIAIELGRVPPAYAEAWAAFQTRNAGHVSQAKWFQAVDDAGQFLDEWAGLALDFGWWPTDIFGRCGLAWFCGGERVRALGPDNAITASGRIFQRQRDEGIEMSKVEKKPTKPEQGVLAIPRPSDLKGGQKIIGGSMSDGWNLENCPSGIFSSGV